MQRLPVAVCLALALTPACSSTDAGLADAITVDGSSTVFPLTTAVVEAFVEEHPSVRIAVGVSGTTAGFDRFCQGELEIQNASRPITRAERDNCAEHQITFVEVPVAYDAVTSCSVCPPRSTRRRRGRMSMAWRRTTGSTCRMNGA